MAVPPPYGRDPFSQVNRLLEAHHNTPGSIRKTCLAVEECLANNRDNLRGFFDKPFSNLLKRVFGYGDFEASWLNIVTKGRDADARALVELLAPDGKLFAAMAQADSDHLVEYIFPTERLPAHTQELLKADCGLGRKVLDTWPQYRGRIRRDPAGRPQVYLNLFEYFMFWTAFYVLRGSSSDSSRNDTRGQSGPSSMMYGMSGFRSMGSAIVGNLMMGRPAGALQSHPYYCLLRTYLEFFLPRNGSGAGGADSSAAARAIGPAGTAAGSVGGRICGLGYGIGLADGACGADAGGWASYKPTLTAAAAGPDSRGAVLLSILVEFWLTDLAEPLPSMGSDRVSGAAQNGGIGGLGGLGVGGVGLAAAGSPLGAVGMAGSVSPNPVAVATPPSVRMLTYQPPSEELVEGLVVLVRYVHVVEQELPLRQQQLVPPGSSPGWRSPGSCGAVAIASPASAGIAAAGARGALGSAGRHGGGGGAQRPQLQPAQAQAGRQTWLPETPVKTPPQQQQRLLVPPTALLVHGHSALPAVQAVSRKVYRQLRRAFSQWPPGSPTSLTPLISLWLSVLAPWCPLSAHTRKATVAASAAAAAAVDTVGALGHGAAGAPVVGGAAGAGSAGGGGLRHLKLNPPPHRQHQEGAGALGSAAAAAAGVMEATAAKLHLGGGGGGGGRDRERDLVGATSRELLSQYKYSAAWRGHVLAHLPFYLLLLPQFAALSLSRLKYRPDVALRDLDRVLAVLAAAGPELAKELRAAEAAYNDYLRPPAAQAAGAGTAAGAATVGGGGVRRRSEGEYGEMVPWWLEQAQDFEAAAAAGASPPLAVQPGVTGRLFASDSAGAAYTTCLLLRNAETLGRPELVAALLQSASAVLPLESILPAAAAADADRGRLGGEGAEGLAAGVDSRRYPKAGRWGSHWSALVAADPRLADPRRLWAHMYRGGGHDPLYRPIASNEMAVLVRPLVAASIRVNAALGLDAPYRAGEEEDDPPEHLGQQALLWARRRGYRVNLRIFAEVQTLAWLLVLALLVYCAARMFGGGGGGGGLPVDAGTAAAARGFHSGAGASYDQGDVYGSGRAYGRASFDASRYYQQDSNLIVDRNGFVGGHGGGGSNGVVGGSVNYLQQQQQRLHIHQPYEQHRESAGYTSGSEAGHQPVAGGLVDQGLEDGGYRFRE